MEPIACRKSSNKEAKPLTSVWGGKVSEVFAGEENNFTQMLLREARGELDIQFTKARREHITMLPLAMTDRNEKRAGFRGAAPKHTPTLYE